MFFDIGGWWLSCDHMFRRFGTPFAVDWLAKNVNGYVYTTAIPADPDLRIDGTEYSASLRRPRAPGRGVRRPRWARYLDTVLPVYGAHFADWWRDRLVPEMQRNFAFLEAQLDAAATGCPWPRSPCCSRTRSTSTTGTGRSTGCSTSPSCRRRSTCGR